MSLQTRLWPTPFAELNSILDELVHRQRKVLADRFVGTYLQGSFAVGGCDMHSDVDFATVTTEELAQAEVAQLQQMHREFFALPSRWAQALDGSYFPRHVMRSCATRGQDLWYLDNGHAQMVRSDHCNTAVVRWIVRNCGGRLAGPPAEELVDPISTQTLRQEIFVTLIDWGRQVLADPAPFANRFYQGFIVLQYCRMLRDLRRGRVGSKPDATAWAKENLDPGWADLIDRAWQTRPGPSVSVRTPADPEDFRRSLALVEKSIDLARSWYPQWREDE
jgi:hypothetical protein